MRTAMIVAMAAVLTACGGGGGDSSSQSSAAPATPATAPAVPASASPALSQLPSQLEIATRLYSDSQRTPEGFLQAQAAPGQGYAATFHLKSLGSTDPSQPRNELCTDDWNEALQWSETEAHRNADVGNLVETNTTDRYFEFVRLSNSLPNAVTRMRVFHCAYLDREGVDLREPEGYAGMLNKAPAGSEDLRALAEYLWTFTAHNNFGTVVLKSAGSAIAGGLEHTLTMAKLTRAANPSACDDIEVFTWKHTFDSGTAALALEIDGVSSFKARQVGAHVEVCLD